jgi:hypothetical protein
MKKAAGPFSASKYSQGLYHSNLLHVHNNLSCELYRLHLPKSQSYTSSTVKDQRAESDQSEREPSYHPL